MTEAALQGSFRFGSSQLRQGLGELSPRVWVGLLRERRFHLFHRGRWQRSETAERPRSVLPDQRLCILEGRQQGGHCALITKISEHHCRVTQQSAPLGTGKRSPSESGAEAFFVETEEVGKLQVSTGAFLRPIFRVFGRRARPIPGTHFLADVATEEPVADLGPQV